MKITEGPWRVGDAGHTVFGPPNGSPAPETIATVKQKANATLIASAPEMADALRECLDVLSLPEPTPDEFGTCYTASQRSGTIAALKIKIRAALVKGGAL